MNNKTKFITFGIVFIFLMVWGYSRYSTQKVAPKQTYHTSYKTENSAMLIGGMAKDREKIDTFKKGLEEENFRAYWDNLHLASSYEKKGDIGNAILYTKKALEIAKSKGDTFQAKMGLARLYRENKQYELAIEEYEWCIEYSNRPDVIEKLQGEIDAVRKVQTTPEG